MSVINRLLIVGIILIYASAGNILAGESSNDTSVNTRPTGDTSTNRSVAFADDGFYWTDFSKMYYTEYETCNTTVLCDKPECSHMDANTCNAYGGSDIQLYEGTLYYYNFFNENGEVGMNLTACDLEGGNKMDIVQLRNDGIGYNCSQVFLIQNDVIVYVGNYGSVCVGELDGNAVKNVRILLEGNNEESTIEDGPYSWTLLAEAGNFYIMGNTWFRGARRPYPEAFSNQLFRYNTVNGECEKVWELPSADEVGEWKSEELHTNGWYIKEGFLYFYLTGNGLWKADLSTGQNEKVFSTNINGTAFFNDKYIIVNNSDSTSLDFNGFGSEERRLVIFDYTGNKLNQVNLKNVMNMYEGKYLSIIASRADNLICQLETNTTVQRGIINVLTGRIQWISKE